MHACPRAELLLRRPWLPGVSDIDQLGKIFQASRLAVGSWWFGSWRFQACPAWAHAHACKPPVHTIVAFGTSWSAPALRHQLFGACLATPLPTHPPCPHAPTPPPHPMQALGTPNEDNWPGVSALPAYLDFHAVVAPPLKSLFPRVGHRVWGRGEDTEDWGQGWGDAVPSPLKSLFWRVGPEWGSGLPGLGEGREEAPGLSWG